MYLTIPFTAGETKTINAGKFFKVKSATYDVACIFFSHSGQEKYKTEFSQGDSINDPDGFSHVTVTSANAQTVIIHVLPVVMISSNLVGDVNALTRFDNQTEYGNQFFAGYDENALAGNYTHIGFYNPVGSGVVSYVRVLRLCSYGTVMTLRMITSADLGSLIDQAPVRNKIFGGADGNTRLMSAWNAAYIGAQRGQFSTDTYGTPVPFDYGNSPIKLNEGYGLCFAPKVQNQGLTVMVELSEEVV